MDINSNYTKKEAKIMLEIDAMVAEIHVSYSRLPERVAQTVLSVIKDNHDELKTKFEKAFQLVDELENIKNNSDISKARVRDIKKGLLEAKLNSLKYVDELTKAYLQLANVTKTNTH